MSHLLEILQSKELWAAGLQGLSTVMAVWLAYRFGLRQMLINTQVQVRQDLRQRQADALKAAWTLLEYLSEKDNQHNLLRMKQYKESNEKTYFVDVENAQNFVFVALPQAFYADGAGLQWSNDLKDKLFEARGIVYGLLLSENLAFAPKSNSCSTTDLRSLNNAKTAERLSVLYQEINTLLRKEVKAVYDF